MMTVCVGKTWEPSADSQIFASAVAEPSEEADTVTAPPPLPKRLKLPATCTSEKMSTNGVKTARSVVPAALLEALAAEAMSVMQT